MGRAISICSTHGEYRVVEDEQPTIQCSQLNDPNWFTPFVYTVSDDSDGEPMQHVSDAAWEAECAKLRDALAAEHDKYCEAVTKMYRMAKEIERLRKGAEDDKHGTAAAVGNVRSAMCVSGTQGILAIADNLDPRLGMPPTAGEVGEPVAYWRRRMHIG